MTTVPGLFLTASLLASTWTTLSADAAAVEWHVVHGPLGGTPPDGSAARPFRTLAEAVAALPAGPPRPLVVRLAEGTHRLAAPIEISAAHTRGQPLMFDGGAKAVTDRIGRHAVEFIEKHQARPFFLYLAFNAVHNPWHAKESDRQRFGHIKEHPLDLYAAMLASMDENIGRVLAKLKELGLEENTVVAFCSDNGPALGNPAIKGWKKDWPEKILVGSVGPLNGHKGSYYDGGIRVPFLLRWPARLKAGTEYRQPVIAMDFHPTFIAAAGAPVPEGTKLDGVNLLPFLTGRQTGAPHGMLHGMLHWKKNETGAVREGDWKLLINQDGMKLQLFNLADDIGERHNLAGAEPELVQHHTRHGSTGVRHCRRGPSCRLRANKASPLQSNRLFSMKPTETPEKWVKMAE